MEKPSFWHRMRCHVTDRWFHYVIAPRYYSKIRPGDVVIDCGANIGDITRRFADRGAEVHAFEPHPVAYAELERRFSGEARVHCYNQAVSSAAGRLRLYLRPDIDAPGALQSSSLMAEKDNVSTDHFVEVEAIRLVDFVRSLGRIRLLKMDIEGAEYVVLPDMLDSGVSTAVDYIVVETHQRSPGLKEAHDALLDKLEQHGTLNVDLSWH